MLQQDIAELKMRNNAQNKDSVLNAEFNISMAVIYAAPNYC